VIPSRSKAQILELAQNVEIAALDYAANAKDHGRINSATTERALTEAHNELMSALRKFREAVAEDAP